MQKYHAVHESGQMHLGTLSSTGSYYQFSIIEKRGLPLSTFIDRALDLFERIESGIIPFKFDSDIICGMLVVKFNKGEYDVDQCRKY
jgi:hypothetical protein